MKFAFRKQSGIKVLGFNLAEDGIYVFLWLVEFALLWHVAAQQGRAVDLGWTCAQCGCSNIESDLLCGFCDTPRPSH